MSEFYVDEEGHLLDHTTDYVCSACGNVIVNVDLETFECDMLCEVCESNLSDYISKLPDEPPTPMARCKTID